MLKPYFVPAILLFALIKPDAIAQQATSFEQLQVLVKTGDTVSVLDDGGQSIKGKILQLTSTNLRLSVNGMPRDIPQASALQIKQRRSDSLANGARNGAIAGAAVGALATYGVCHAANCANGDAILAFMFFTGLGTGVGVGIDALIIPNQVIYRPGARTSLTRVNIKPFVRGSNRGLSLSVSF